MHYSVLLLICLLSSIVKGAPVIYPQPLTNQQLSYTKKDLLTLFSQLKEGTSRDTKRFWNLVQNEASPLVEELDSKYSRVIFLYRSNDSKVKDIIVTQYGLASFDRREWGMTKISGVDVWYLEKVIPVGTRLVYAIKENTPMIYMADSRTLADVPWAELISNAKADPFNKFPYKIPGKFALGDKDLTMSVFYHPAAKAAHFSQTSTSPHGELVEVTVPSKFLPEKKRELYIYLPSGYRKDDKKNQDLLVVFDGDAYVEFIPTPKILDNLIALNLIPKTLAVFIRNPDPNPSTRLRDLIGNKEFYNFLTRELMPWMKTNYAFNSEETVIAGSSAGGWAAAFSSLEFPQVFPKALCQSPAMAWPFQGEDNWLLNKYVDADLKGRKFFIDVGTLENAQWQNHGHSLAQSARALRDIVKAKGVPVEFNEFAGGHDYISWEISLAEGLQYLMKR